jgi:hypothetical protein
MKNPFNKIIKMLLLFVCICNVNTSFAQAPQKMSYQAVIRNSSNALITNQAVGIRVSILKDSETGTEVFKEIYNPNPTANSNGLVSLEIGSGIALTGIFAEINWAEGPYFIKTETDPTGGTNYTITGASPLNSVPYALFSAYSGGPAVWGLTGNAGTNPETDFIGTTDQQDVIFKRDNNIAGRLGESNTSFGVNSLNANGTGNYNTAIGCFALESNTTGIYNTAIGASALTSNTTGENNTAIGVGALIENTIGQNNTAIGIVALRYNTIGRWNTANGSQALSENTTGQSNTAIGSNALLENTTGNFNTAVGSTALQSNTEGWRNTAVGLDALGGNISGYENTSTGAESLFRNTTGSLNTATGHWSQFNTTTGNNNTSIGAFSLNTVTTGDNNIAIGYESQVPIETGNNQVRIGNASVTYAGIQVPWTITSDLRWKSNIQKSNLGLAFIKELNPVSYTRKDVQIENHKSKIQESTTNLSIEYGFVAQELESTLVKFGAAEHGMITRDHEGMYGVRYNDLLAPMVKAMQEQQTIIENQDKKIEKLSNEMADLKKDMDTLKLLLIQKK